MTIKEALSKCPKLKELLEEISNDFFPDGCNGCGTISTKTINKVNHLIGNDLIDEIKHDEFLDK